MPAIFNGKIAKAFAVLRQKGFIAKMNHLCCQSCGWAAIPEDATNVVFFHAQDRDACLEDGELYLAWSGDSRAICQALSDVGLIAIHNGSEDERILVKNQLH